MPTDELERELRSTLAQVAAGFESAGQARLRLIQRDYHPRTGHRRLAGSLAATAVAAATVLALGLSGVFGSGGPAPAQHPSPVRLAAFTVVSNHNGTITLTLRPGVPFHPAALKHLLARHGIPALVRVGSYCRSNPPPSAPGAVETHPRLKGYPPGAALPKSTKLIIRSSKLGHGTEIGFGFFRHNRIFIQNIIFDHAHTCTTGIPHAR